MAVATSGYSLQVGVKVDTGSLRTQLDTFGSRYTLNINANVTGLDQTGKLNTNIHDITNNVQQMSAGMDAASSATSKFANSATADYGRLGKTIQGAIESQKSLGKVLIDQARTRAVTLAINEVIQLTQQAIQTIRDFDDALTEMKKVSDLSGEALDKYTRKLGELGETVARTRTEMVESATEFIKSGYSEEDSARLAKVAELYRNIADEEMSSAESAKFIISQMKAFGDDTEGFANHAIDAINNVSNNMAVSSANIATALSKTSSAMGALGNTYEETLGMVTAGSEIMQGQSSKVARGLRTIGNNIASLAQQQKVLALETQEGIKQIQLFDEATGDMRNTYDILGDIAQQWDNMSNAQKQAIGITLANKNQFEVFTATVSNFADAQKAVTLATESENSALNENARYMESISAKANLVKSQFQELILGDGGLSNFTKILLDATNALLKFANSGIGKTIINLTLFYAALVLVSKGVAFLTGQFATNLMVSITMFIVQITSATTATEAFAIALEALNVNPVILALTALVGVGYALYTVNNKLKTSIKDAGDALKESLDEVEQSKQKIDELRDKIAKINNEKLKVTDEKDLRNLDIERANLESQLLVEKAISEEKERQARIDAEKAVNKIGWSYGYRKGTHSIAETGNGAYGETVDKNLKNQIEDIKTLSKEIDEYRQQQQWLIDTYGEYNEMSEHYQKQYDNLSESITTANDNLTKLTANSAENVTVLQTVIDAGGDTDGVFQALISTWEEAVNKSNEVKDSQVDQEEILKQTAEAYGLTAEAVKEYMDANDVSDITEACEALSRNAENAEEVADAYKNAVSAVGDMTDSFSSLNSAVEEYNSTGALSLDTIMDLLSLGNEYISLLQIENGVMSLSEDGAIALANAKISEAEATAVQEAQTELAKIKQHEYNSVLVESATASSVAVTSAQSAGQAILASGEDALKAKQMWAECWETISNGYKFTTQQDKAYAKEVEQSLKNRIVSLESLRSNISNVTKATDKNTKSTKGNTKATNENTKALKERLEALKETKQQLEDTKDTYDKVISYIENKLKDAIKKLEDERDAELDALERVYEELEESTQKRIEALKEEKEATEDSLKAQIDGLKEAKELSDENIKTQIDNLKELKKQEEEYWQGKINDLKAANDALNDQIELENLLAQLERAKASKKMIYREGQGFVYEEDAEAVSTAEKNLQQYYRKKKYEEALKDLEDYKDAVSKNYEQQIEDLEDYRDKVNKSYEQQIKDLEKLRDTKKRNYDAQIKELEAYIKKEKENYDNQVKNIKENYQQKIDYLQKYLDKFTEGVNEYEKQQSRQQALILTGIDFEKEAWENQLTNLEAFVTNYTALQQQIEEAINKVEEAQRRYNEAVNEFNSTTGSTYSGGGGYNPPPNNSTQKSQQQKPYQNMIGRYYSWKKGVQYANLSTGSIGKTDTQGTHTMRVEEVVREGNGSYWAIGTNVNGNRIKIQVSDLMTPLRQALYSGGTYGVKDDGIAVVGDDPKFSELVIGSKLNSGAKILNASKGTGVIPHNLTSTLVSMAQAFQGQTQLQTTNNSTATSISIGNITLPNIENGEQFVDYLQNFNLDMTTLAYTR